MSEKPSIIKRVFKKLWMLINTTRKLILNLIFFVILFAVFGAIFDDSDKIVVPSNTALILDLKGDIVEQKKQVDPADALMSEALGKEEENPEILLADIKEVLATAKDDKRISTLVIYPQNLRRAGLTHLQEIAASINEFKESGKEVIAYGDYFTQDQYYLAAHADKVWLNPEGAVILEGYGRYRTYYKAALDKLNITQHIFKVGTYKSAIEPYIRDDMSEPAKEANRAWLSSLWNSYKYDIAQARNLTTDDFDETAAGLLEKIKLADGSFGQYAKAAGLIDELRTREDIRLDMISKVGKAEKGSHYNQIHFKDYVKATKNPYPMVNPLTDKVAVIVAKGAILNGHQKPGTVGGDSTALLLRKARLNDKVKAVVLRVDSPGGSAYASEIIRQEVELIKAAGKPVIASMGQYAASGGYWISASANEIWASPNTITGSIGIFGMFMTFEKALDKLGIHTDGVGTTDLAGLGVTRPLNEDIGHIIQASINRGYKNFITLVAENRNMSPEDVDKIAQGRVWTGAKGQEIGLVDKLGGLDDAIAAAADRAGLKMYDTLLIEQEVSAKDLFLRNLLDQAKAFIPADTLNQSTAYNPALQQMIADLVNEYEKINQLNDPRGIYSVCLTCEIN
ncbi:signal peptide peptidase SppA [Thalassomonas sp. M1454]|uniref:signal peptide peptidase SppA n=1 Tax=Thalassomonas sp. M1454 TaxID=2594477 RepID=UPI00117D05F1|nr:signal peptide peptidase SppA [Thalassomonas sp. M1454]TRX56852.1 signal peptide peptidase SppA [Thalassomonas sp. M1454]